MLGHKLGQGIKYGASQNNRRYFLSRERRLRRNKSITLRRFMELLFDDPRQAGRAAEIGSLPALCA